MKVLVNISDKYLENLEDVKNGTRQSLAILRAIQNGNIIPYDAKIELIYYRDEIDDEFLDS